jgi:hypothetical protein
MKQLTTFILLTITMLSSKAQSTCEVAVPALKGTYTGACDNNKAEGEGKATGEDTYEGTFKKGYPDGTGKYTWKNGDYYFGHFKKGARDGKGDMHFAGKKDSVQTGFWKKDSYKGEYENPYQVTNASADIGRVSISKIKGGSTITFSVENMNGNPASVTDIRLVNGNYISKASNQLTKKEVTVFQGVTYPFRAVFTFTGGQTVDIELFETSSWDIDVPINGR